MSQLEQAFRRIADPLLDGREANYDPDASATVFDWITLKLAILDRSAESPAFEALDLVNFAVARTPIPALKLFLFDCDSRSWAAQYVGSSTRIAQTPEEFAQARTPNLESITFGVGRLLVLGIYNRSPLKVSLQLPGEALVFTDRIGGFSWPPRSISEWEAEHVAQTLHRFLKSQVNQARPGIEIDWG